MMMIMRMKRFMFDECVGGCRGRLLIDILRDDPSSFKVCNSHTRCTSPVSSVICCGFPLEVHLTLLQVGFQLVFVAFTLSASFPLP